MSIKFNGIGANALTFQAKMAYAGAPVMMSGNDTVKMGVNGGIPAGVAVTMRGGLATVQTQGYVELPYGGSAAPALGWTELVCDGNKGLRAVSGSEKGRPCLVVNVDTDKKRMGLFL